MMCLSEFLACLIGGFAGVWIVFKNFNVEI